MFALRRPIWHYQKGFQFYWGIFKRFDGNYFSHRMTANSYLEPLQPDLVFRPIVWKNFRFSSLEMCIGSEIFLWSWIGTLSNEKSNVEKCATSYYVFGYQSIAVLPIYHLLMSNEQNYTRNSNHHIWHFLIKSHVSKKTTFEFASQQKCLTSFGRDYFMFLFIFSALLLLYYC